MRETAISLLFLISCAADPKTSTTHTFSEPAMHTKSAPQNQPEELGIISWRRDFEAARAEAKEKNLPLLVLFDEIPGCSTVKGFGDEVLRNPIIADVIDTYFIPVAVYNNTDGKDREILDSFGEPAWNNPVVRVLDNDRRDLIERYAGDYHLQSFGATLQKTLTATGRKPPAYLNDLLAADGAKTEVALFSMYCFWSGEVGFGQLPGVISTRPGFVGGREAVEVTFDTKQTSFEAIAQLAAAKKIASYAYAQSDAQLAAAKRFFPGSASIITSPMRYTESDDKYQLRHTTWWYVPMYPWQATRANSFLGEGASPEEVFSPRQRALYQKLSSSPTAELKPYIAGSLDGALPRLLE